jgi:hypothetical protein
MRTRIKDYKLLQNIISITNINELHKYDYMNKTEHKFLQNTSLPTHASKIWRAQESGYLVRQAINILTSHDQTA